MAIIRDKHNIIVQHRPNDPAYLEGGDSARVTGIMALCGSNMDKALLPVFVIYPEGYGVRHPFQQLIKDESGQTIQLNNNDPGSFTRDQALCLMAGLWSAPEYNENFTNLFFWSHAKRLFFGQNTLDQEGNKKPWYKSRDPMHPGQIGFMIQAARIKWLYPILPICWLFTILEILVNVYITPNRESNQLLCTLVVTGKWALKLYTKLHPNWKMPIIEYWSGWRDQKEIGDLFINYILTRMR